MGGQEENLGVVAALVRASFLISAVYAESARDHGLTPQQGQLLCVLMGRPYRMNDLGATLRLAKSSLTELVDRTSQRGLVRREPDPSDGRAVLVTLTDQGAAAAETFYAETCDRVARVPGSLGAGEQGVLAELLGRVVKDNTVGTVFLDWDDDVHPPA
ncbi:winged helix-turn-helix transcriptional regulator [Herbidospora galbida]|uniref:Winged helix-turn-helix transcriptional regulator n=1 Tax=Herbidospora galbida TaxID=2575442 RepID=A0A4U3MH29_9ACTN|nr:MarR family winged helix-turn-helix transcriptional regulator [Herbidospora galbida]TKK87146.1 winged helix-turn-helix transcriptional regulator [Herbidospora galbida]